MILWYSLAIPSGQFLSSECEQAGRPVSILKTPQVVMEREECYEKKRFKNNNIAAIKWFHNSPIKLFSDRIISNVILPCCTKNHIKSPIYIVIATKDQLEETEKICWFKFQLRHKMRRHHLHQRSMDHPTAGAENLTANSRHDTTVEPRKTWNSPTVVT